MTLDPLEQLSEGMAREIGGTCACLHLRQASRRVTQLFDDALRPVGLRATQFTLLTAVRRLGPVPIQQLAERLVMDRTTLTRNLQVLERRQLMRIEPGSDRRVHEVSLTSAGARLLARAFPHWESAQAQVTRALGAERFDRLLSDLRLAVETPKAE